MTGIASRRRSSRRRACPAMARGAPGWSWTMAHRRIDPRIHPGEIDLTAHSDSSPPARANPGLTGALEATRRRLADPAQTGMLFKVLELG